AMNAEIVAPNAHNALALALGALSASGSQLVIAGPLGLHAQANAGAGVTGNVGALTNLDVNAHGGQATPGNRLPLTPHASDLHNTGCASGCAMGDFLGGGGFRVKGGGAATADLTTKTHGIGQVAIGIGGGKNQTVDFGWASAGLTIDPSAASAGIKTGAITVDAEAHLLAVAAPNSGGARADLSLDAAAGPVDIGGVVAV